MKGPLLIVPSLERGRGGGHLVRSLALLRGLRGEGREAFLYIPPGAPFGGEGGGDSAWYIRREEETVGQAWDFIILDRFRTPHKEFEAWAARGPLIGIDEGGSRRNRFDFLIDLLPGPPGFSGANIFAPCLLPLPKNRRPSFLPARDLVPEDGKTQGGRPLKILVSFGMEDPAGLTLPVVQALTFGKKYSGKEPPAPFPAEITVLAGNDKTATSSLPKAPGLRAFETIRELREHLAEYDLLITHFGLTAFEALHARLPVILLSPGRYHENLARRTFPVSAGRGKGRAAEISRRIYRKDPRGGHFPGINFEFLKTLGEQCERAARELDRLQAAEGTAAPQTLGELITAFTPLVPLSCPACGRGGRTNHRVLARFPRRTYRQCPRCGMVYMLRTDPPPIEYETDYFFDFYKKQYGKTYPEDFPHLKELGKGRLKEILELLGRDGGAGKLQENLPSPGKGASPRKLLDIGCAYGPFLAAAREGGFAPLGIDPAEDAIRYVREELRIPALRGFFPDIPAPELEQPGAFDAVTLWYVIEHFQDLRQVLGKLRRLLKKGGVLAFSTPSFSGISGRSSPVRFLEKSPPDHWTFWTPRYCRRLLGLYGFELKKIRVTGHHPERFPFWGPRLTGKQGPACRFFLWISRTFRLGDTFEAYAIKKEDN